MNLCSDNGDLAILPDYTLDTSTIFQRTARSIIKEGQGPRLLLNTGYQGPNSKLPTWAPDWAIENIPLFTIVKPRYMASDSSVSISESVSDNIRLGNQEDQIIVTALTVDRVVYVGSVYHYEQKVSVESPTNIAERRSGEDAEHERDASAQKFLDPADGIDDIESGFGSNSTATGHIIPMIDHNDPDWHELPNLYRLFLHAGALFKHSPWYRGKEWVDMIWRTLLCIHAGSMADHLVYDYGEAAQAYFEINGAICDPSSGHQYLKTVEDRVRQIFRDEIESSENPREALRLRLTQYVSIQYRIAKEFDQALMRFGHTHRLAQTSKGIIGMVPNAAAEDDYMVCIKDMEAPLILRKASAAENTFSVIGPAYFHGFMAGEEDHQQLLDRDDWAELILV